MYIFVGEQAGKTLDCDFEAGPVAERAGGADALRDRKVESLARVEQGYLRQLLFGDRDVARCAICGNEYPIDLLVAGHIKRRSACSIRERKDARHVVMPVCKLGCDELFERGYVSVDDNGRVASSTRAVTKRLAERLRLLEGEHAIVFVNRRVVTSYGTSRMHFVDDGRFYVIAIVASYDQR